MDGRVLAANAKDAKKPWPMVRLGDVCEIVYGTRVRKKDSKGYAYPVYGGGGETFRWDTYNRDSCCIVSRFAMSTECVRFVKGKFFLNDSGLTVSSNDMTLSQAYLDWCLFCKQDEIYALGKGSAQKNLEVKAFANLLLPLPPLPVQRAIVARLEKELGEAEKVATGFRKIAEKAEAEFKAELDETFKALEEDISRGDAQTRRVRLGDVCEEIRERIPSSKVSREMYITTDNMLKECRGVHIADSVPQGVGLVNYHRGDILLSNIRPYLKKSWLANRDGGCSSDVIVFRSKRDDLDNEYLFRVLSQDAFFEYSMRNVSGTKMPRGKREWIKQFEFPLPPLPVQRSIVARLDAARACCDKLKSAAERGLESAENLRKAILKEAFQA